MEEGIAELLLDAPLCEEETMIILFSVERPVGEHSTMRATTVQHLPLFCVGKVADAQGEAGAVAGPLHSGRRSAHEGLTLLRGSAVADARSPAGIWHDR
jgi:hypothetical protein